MTTQKRVVWIDILRVIAMISVIAIHVISNTIYTFHIEGQALSIYQILLSIFSFSIPLFVMISGLLFLNPKKKMDTKKIITKYCGKILFLILFFGTIFVMIEEYYVNKTIFVGLDTLLLRILSSNTWEHMWYLYIILGLYLITPILRILTANIKEKDFRYFLIILYIFAFFIPEIVKYFSISIAFSIPIASPYLFYYLYGYYVVNYKVSNKYTKFSYVLSILTIFFCIFSHQYHFNIVSMSFVNTWSFLLANGLLLFFKNRNIESKWNSFIQSLGVCSLGIYILHQVYVNFIFKFMKWDMILSYPYLGFLFYTFSILIITYITVYLLRKIKIVRKIL